MKRVVKAFRLSVMILLIMLISNCTTYKPIVDTAGRSGTFPNTKAEEITNDLQHCEMIADKNTSFFGNLGHLITSPIAETKYKMIYKNCMKNRGHSVLND